MLGLNTLAKKQQDEGERQNLFEKIESCIARLDHIIHDIVHFSRNSRMDVVTEQIDFTGVFNTSISQCRDIEGVEKVNASIQIVDDTVFYTDKSRLEVVLKNILSNSIKYHDPKQKHPYVKIMVHVNSREANIEISDNGVGIHDKHIDEILKMFYRADDTKSSGSGLGLYIVKEVIDKLGGKICVQAYRGGGTTFFISIPNVRTPVLQ